MSAHWWGELGVVPLVGSAMSTGVLSGDCKLRTTFGSLSADGWGCVLTLLVVWLEASQYWSLKAVGWGRVSVPKWQPPGELTLIHIPWPSTTSVLALTM